MFKHKFDNPSMMEDHYSGLFKTMDSFTIHRSDGLNRVGVPEKVKKVEVRKVAPGIGCLKEPPTLSQSP